MQNVHRRVSVDILRGKRVVLQSGGGGVMIEGGCRKRQRDNSNLERGSYVRESGKKVNL